MSSSSFATKYRPRNLERIIGHEQAVTRLQGMIKSGKVPHALAFFGPSSVGKTTLARAFAASVNGVKNATVLGPDYKELNAADQRTMEDMRELIRISRFKAANKFRVIVVDEAQQLLGNNAAAQILLKPLEEPSPHMIWILCSMDPSKFSTTAGKAIANRCNQFLLEPPNDANMTKQAKRIIKAEEMTYMTDELTQQVVEVSSAEMRTMANLLEAVSQYADGMEKKPKKLSEEVIAKVLSSAATSDDELAKAILMGVYTGEFDKVLSVLLDVKDAFGMVQKLIWANSYLLFRQALRGKNHPELKHWAPLNKALAAATKDKKVGLGKLVVVNSHLVQLKNEILAQGASFAETAAARLFLLIKELEK